MTGKPAKRAQVWSMDFAASLVIFTTALAVLLFAWIYVASQNEQQTMFIQMESAAMSASDSLIRQPGIPEGWTASSVTAIGLASQENILNATKVGYFLGMENDTIKSLLGVGNYDFYFEVRYTNGTLAQLPNGDSVAKGNYPQNASIAVPSERYVIYMDKIARMKFVIWI